MGRSPCCEKGKVKKGAWSPEEDNVLKTYLHKHGTPPNWISLPLKAGLKRCGKSCRLRWLNYLRPDIKHGGFTDEEDNIICTLYRSMGSRWSVIASNLPGRTDNDIKNYWNTKLKKKLLAEKFGPNNNNSAQVSSPANFETNYSYVNLVHNHAVSNSNSSRIPFDHQGAQFPLSNNSCGMPSSDHQVSSFSSSSSQKSGRSEKPYLTPNFKTPNFKTPKPKEGNRRTKMNSTIIRSRISSGLSKFKSNNLRLFSVQVPLEPSHARPIIAVAEEFATDPNSSSKKSTPEGVPQVSKPLRFLKYGFIGALTGATAAAGYVSYAYTLDEVDQKTKALRESVNYKVGGDSSSMDKYRSLLYSAVMTVPAKAIELYLDLRTIIEEHVKGFTEPTSDKLLPDLHPAEQHVFTLVLDLNETLLYSDWKRDRGWKTFKRPGVDIFLEHLAKFYEIIVYSDQMEMYVGPVCDRLDPNHYIRYRLARGATNYVNGKHYRDLSKLNRDPAKILYVSAHALDSSLQPENCVPIKPYKLESDDTALLDLIPFLEFVARNSPADIRTVLSSYERNDIAKEFLDRSKEYHKRMQEQRKQKRFWQR